ncbi:hypothetical protein [Pedobacter foliorum]|uniref:hypothetical protein n=1 Tax=Pedobacter foliorum TaxID=2739058 RepID=UPI001566AD75|nr:hypothetical protein [Pedobacter foliorum]NRF39596.1 hypothetical protein [Pedobacter foliorum]
MKINNSGIKNIGKGALVLLALLLVNNTTQAQYGILNKDLLKSEGAHILPDSIIYHTVRVDGSGNLLPWYATDLGKSYDQTLKLVWKFWKDMEIDTNGEKYYMNHQVWKAEHDKRGIGGDQVAMGISSWDLLYNYSGDEAIITDMKYQADYYLAHSISSPTCKWPNIPYPYNTDVESGIYDGDMMAGKGVLQPDKAGSLGFELVRLYKKTGETKYLDVAIKIANTMASTIKSGDANHSPWPFKVNAITGKVADLGKNDFYKEPRKGTYTTNFTGTLELFSELIKLNKGNKAQYQKAFNQTLSWFKNYPEKTNDWGPFFEDVPGYSKTQINATTYAMYVMEHKELYADWKKTVNSIFNWVHTTFNNKDWAKYGVTVTNEQTAYPVVGNSHTARQASMELLYWAMTGDTTLTRNAVRALTWATYAVDFDGKNYYPTNDVWMTDGYGDYVRHYIRAMSIAPQLAPSDSDHLLKTSSTVQHIDYQNDKISYRIFDQSSKDLLTLTSKPVKVSVNGKPLKESNDKNKTGWFWQSLDKGGILCINQNSGSQVDIIK